MRVFIVIIRKDLLSIYIVNAEPYGRVRSALSLRPPAPTLKPATEFKLIAREFKSTESLVYGKEGKESQNAALQSILNDCLTFRLVIENACQE